MKCSERETFLRSFCFCKKNQKARATCFLGRGRRPDAPKNAAQRHPCCDSNKDIRRRRQKSTRSVLPRQWHASHVRESSRKGDGFILFASAKRTKKQLLGRAKSCQWQVFVRRRPPKQGELRTDVSKATMFQGEREQKHAQRAAPTGASFLLVRKFPKGNEFILFASAKRTKKQPGLRPATSVQIAGRYIILD